MKTFIATTIATFAIGLGVHAQENKMSNNTKMVETLSFKPKNKVHRFYALKELKAMNKGELTSIYLRRTQELVNILPFMAMSSNGSLDFKTFGIRKQNENSQVLETYKRSAEQYNEQIQNMVIDFIPYADTNDIVKSIVYMENIIEKIRLGIKR